MSTAETPDDPDEEIDTVETGDDEAEDDVFSGVYGHNGAKIFIGNALRSGDVHVALEGPPGSGKSSFLMALESNVPGVMYRDADQITASQLREALKKDPPILLIDEIDALDNDAYDVLSTPMEHGRLVRDSAREQYDVEVGTQIIAACNDLSELPENIQSRFQIQQFEKYTEEEYIELCGKMLKDEIDWITDEDTGRKVGRKVLEITGEADIRSARDVAQMVSDEEEIETMTAAMNDPDADVEAKPLSAADISRASDEVAKNELRDTLVDDLMRSSEPDTSMEDGDPDGFEEPTASTDEIDAEIEQAVDAAVETGGTPP